MAETDRQAIVRVEGLSKHFGDGSARVDAPIDVNLEVYPGQVVELYGPEWLGQDDPAQLHRVHSRTE